ncbi:hypothetical protein KUCAC02_032716 [Chaenocephalus aceratus]|nr:hypothetical protein KUCAC02_032716 [Chaenocephalus aceratus]
MSGSSRVGFCLSDKKRRRINLQAFADFCAGHGVEVVEIDLTQPMGPQGPFDVIVHKLSDVIVEAEHDSQSQQLLANFQSFVSDNPSTVLLDPLPAMTRLLDRFASYRIMSKLHNSLRDWRVCSPPYLEVQSADDLINNTSSLSLTPVCKTRVAHGSLSHESFVNHGAVLHKVFVVGEKHFCVERPSLKNFPPGPCDRNTIFFKQPSCVQARVQLCSHSRVPQFFSALLSHIQSVLGKQPAVSPEEQLTPGASSAAAKDQ